MVEELADDSRLPALPFVLSLLTLLALLLIFLTRACIFLVAPFARTSCSLSEISGTVCAFTSCALPAPRVALG